MCSVQEDADLVPAPKPQTSASRICMKCKEKTAVVVTRVNDAFCRECFMVYVVHKFRSTIGKSHLIRDGEKVLLAYSGGPASSALLHLVQEGLSERAHKKLRFIPSVVHVDESGAVGLASDEQTSKNDAILKVMRTTGYQSFFTTLDMALSLPSKDTAEKDTLFWKIGEDVGTECFSQPDCNSKVAKILKTMKSMTAKEDFVRNLRNQVLAAIAQQHGYEKVMLGDTSTRLAVRILSDIGQGRGAQVSADTSFADGRHEDVMFVRPIRELTLKEVAMYNSLNQVDSVFVPTLTTKLNSGASIDHLTEGFVTGLQADFPSTVSNITRTAGKLDTAERTGPQNVCLICESALDTDVADASALRAVEFSEILSKQGPGNRVEVMLASGDADESRVLLESHSVNKDALFEQLCYGCRLTVKDMGDRTLLPATLTQSALNRKTMRASIQDCLIEGADSG